ncbi:MAG: peptide-methionine (S)-S-oxide reductase MsrA [Nanoarchaeota archaeon]
MKKEIATFGAGCFWHVEYAFSRVKGVLSTTVGYMGGDEKKYLNPTYKEVCSDRTGHAEVVQVEFDPSKVSYGDLLQVFWNNHNPTTLNRQGFDIGTQYRSVIFYHSQQQKKVAEKSRKEVQVTYKKKIVTEIVPAGKFFKAEEHHQKYFQKHGKVC